MIHIMFKVHQFSFHGTESYLFICYLNMTSNLPAMIHTPQLKQMRPKILIERYRRLSYETAVLLYWRVNRTTQRKTTDTAQKLVSTLQSY